MGQGMGLSRLGAEPDLQLGEEPPVWKAPWESLIKREVGRRLWWNVSRIPLRIYFISKVAYEPMDVQLVFMDWSLAPSYNFSSSIQPDQSERDGTLGASRSLPDPACANSQNRASCKYQRRGPC